MVVISSRARSSPCGGHGGAWAMGRIIRCSHIPQLCELCELRCHLLSQPATGLTKKGPVGLVHVAREALGPAPAWGKRPRHLSHWKIPQIPCVRVGSMIALTRAEVTAEREVSDIRRNVIRGRAATPSATHPARKAFRENGLTPPPAPAQPQPPDLGNRVSSTQRPTEASG